MKITETENGYEVWSESGKTYNISYAGSGDADPDYVALWKCDCPAGRNGKNCRHMREFLEMRRDEEIETADYEPTYYGQSLKDFYSGTGK